MGEYWRVGEGGGDGAYCTVLDEKDGGRTTYCPVDCPDPKLCQKQYVQACKDGILGMKRENVHFRLHEILTASKVWIGQSLSEEFEGGEPADNLR